MNLRHILFSLLLVSFNALGQVRYIDYPLTLSSLSSKGKKGFLDLRHPNAGGEIQID